MVQCVALKQTSRNARKQEVRTPHQAGKPDNRNESTLGARGPGQGARGKGKTHRSCAVVKKKKITSGDELKLQRTNQPEMETSQVTRADEKTGQPKLLGTEQRDRQTDTALFPSPRDL